ncbi:hypothetical protein GLYMA_03G166000v4 [Glycine max]|uniref:Eisosome protein SEG2 n=1 Tax=Glycine max TaxID=3847 RepID=I1JP64_SOYBN|nr:uncharacterized protein LOC100787541 [Glycine max]KAG5043622.1 hypothetical protein JHK87_007537 [Glycine soja]KAG5072477.1 hypothetical protein JHK86_007688 [Glycine max]KAH1070350.1 hypothetical protein GYH30_007447 [Glycine max]KAH1258439.1 hypothetical protein GmHk_03G008171 [Glycine max]KRH67437.1 hypothetical protein GLYMA_03G166000v4 [Glycine max]|eukprot:XP_006576953.1 uncharacterized protein LOC100787541 [Glycine max]
MGCFLHCFGSSKSTKPRRKAQHHHHRIARDRLEQPTACCSVQDYSETVVLSTASQEVQAKPLEQINVSPKKKVTFDVNVKTYEPEPDEVADYQLVRSEEGREESAFVEKLSQTKSYSEVSSVTSARSYPTNHRYHSCTCSDDEDGAMEYWDSDVTDEDEDDDDDGDSDMGEEYDEVEEDFEDGIVYSRSRNGANQVVVGEVESPIPMHDKDLKSIGLNSNVRDRSVYVNPLLNPVENLTQWKTVKAKRAPPLVSQKENLVLNQESRAAFGAETETPKKLNREIAVDASLSNWLGSSETTPVVSKGLYAGTPERSSSSSQGSNSVVSHEDRPILGALTVEELKHFSASSLPRKSPRDEMMPIIGSVGSYWNCGGYAEDSGSANRVRSRKGYI